MPPDSTPPDTHSPHRNTCRLTWHSNSQCSAQKLMRLAHADLMQCAWVIVVLSRGAS